MSAALPKPGVSGLRDVFLMPGALYCAAVPSLVTTVLGSCIAVCVWDRIRRTGGMNHYVLPRSRADHDSARYGDVAIDRLLEEMDDLGSRADHLVAKIFGGAAVLPIGGSAETVGARNQQIALDRLEHHRVPIVVCRTGGERGLMIKFATDSGQVTVRKIAAMNGVDSDPPA